ncbi:hypothetical protein MKW92_036327 [Papaver armeniacum]|nr:hypothetical protein MKW92_036327 [Papaver armeniacum]
MWGKNLCPIITFTKPNYFKVVVENTARNCLYVISPGRSSLTNSGCVPKLHLHVGKHPLGPLLYHVSPDFVYPVHESPDRFACVGGGADIARMVLTPHFGASRSCSLDRTIFLAQRSLAQAGDDAYTGDFITTVAIWKGEIYDYSTNDTTDLRKLHRLGPVRRHFI